MYPAAAFISLLLYKETRNLSNQNQKVILHELKHKIRVICLHKLITMV